MGRDVYKRQGHNGLRLGGLVNINADDKAVVLGSCRSDRSKHRAAAGKDDLCAGAVPAVGHGLQLGRSAETGAIEPGVVDFNIDIHFLGSRGSTLHKAVAIPAAGGVVAAAAAAEAQLGVAFLDDSITGEVAALLFLESDAGDILQKMCIRDRW